MPRNRQLPLPVLDALPLGAHRLVALTDPELLQTCGVFVAFTTREGGVSTGSYASLNLGGHVGDDPRAVQRNRLRVLQAAGAADVPLVTLNQVHGVDIVDARASLARPVSLDADPAATQLADADGLVVEGPDVAAMLFSADCLLVAVVSPSGRFALAHAGWRGAVNGIVGKAVRHLAAGDPFAPGAFNAYLGPHICGECFEVGEDVRERFAAVYGDVALCGERNVSLSGAVTADLLGAGLRPERIVDAHECTRCHSERYFSYRAEGGTCGRIAAFALRHGAPVQNIFEADERTAGASVAST